MDKIICAKGFSLIELLVVLLLSTVLILGFSATYSSISGLVHTGKSLENAQEVLRTTSEVFTRSLKQTSEVLEVTADKLTLEQTANSIACDGSTPTFDYTEVFTLANNTLQCNIGAGNEAILTDLESLTFSQQEQIVSITVMPQALSGEPLGEGPTAAVTIDVALSAIIIKNAMGI